MQSQRTIQEHSNNVSRITTPNLETMVQSTFFGDNVLGSRCPPPSLQELGDASSSPTSRPRVELNPYVPAAAAAALVFGRKFKGLLQ